MEIEEFQYVRGHLIGGEIGGNGYVYVDTYESVDEEPSCIRCGEYPTPEGHDACLGTLEGVKFACCGHGTEDAYITFNNGKTIKGKKAIEYLKNKT